MIRWILPRYHSKSTAQHPACLYSSSGFINTTQDAQGEVWLIRIERTSLSSFIFPPLSSTATGWLTCSQHHTYWEEKYFTHAICICLYLSKQQQKKARISFRLWWRTKWPRGCGGTELEGDLQTPTRLSPCGTHTSSTKFTSCRADSTFSKHSLSTFKPHGSGTVPPWALFGFNN